MPFCPKCQYEYHASAKACPECKEDLVDRLEEMPSAEDFAEVYMVSNRMEADVVRSILEENGIDYLIRDLRMFPVLPDFGRRARLRVAVPKSQEAQARKVLEEARSDGALTEQGRFL